MRKFNKILQTLLDKGVKSKCIIAFCVSIQGYQRAKKNYNCSSTISIKRVRYEDLVLHHSNVKIWLSTFDLEEDYKPEDFLED